MSYRILIADDHGVLRAGLRALLSSEPGLEVVGEAADGPQALLQTQQLHPDVVLLDISMPGPDGIEVTRQIKRVAPNTRVLILTVHEDDGLLRAAVRAGASGYIIKRAVEAELISAIHAACRGDLYVHPAMTRALLHDLEPVALADAGPVEPLTAREIEVLRLVARGYTNRQVAEEFCISIRTVESHRASIMDKLGLHSRVDLVRYATKQGLLDG
jgi:two-component system response regulator NreC